MQLTAAKGLAPSSPIAWLRRSARRAVLAFPSRRSLKGRLTSPSRNEPVFMGQAALSFHQAVRFFLVITSAPAVCLRVAPGQK